MRQAALTTAAAIATAEVKGSRQPTDGNVKGADRPTVHDCATRTPGHLDRSKEPDMDVIASADTETAAPCVADRYPDLDADQLAELCSDDGVTVTVHVVLEIDSAHITEQHCVNSKVVVGHDKGGGVIVASCRPHHPGDTDRAYKLAVSQVRERPQHPFRGTCRQPCPGADEGRRPEPTMSASAQVVGATSAPSRHHSCRCVSPSKRRPCRDRSVRATPRSRAAGRRPHERVGGRGARDTS